LRHVAIGTVISEIATVRWNGLLVAFVALGVSTFVAALRWSMILGILDAFRGVGTTYPLALIGVFFGQALPAGVGGDVVRIWLARKRGITTRVAISSIIADRVTGFLSILVIVTVQLPLLKALIPKSALFSSIAVAVAVGYAAVVISATLDRVPQAMHRFRVIRGFAAVSADLRAILLSPRIVPVLTCGTAIQLLNVAAVYALVRGFALPAAFADCLLIVPFANVLQTIPISIAGWGLRESFFVAAFGVIAIAAPPALAVSVMFGLLILINSLPGGVLWLMQGDATRADLDH
jgi:uncharacterized protein (TIRG00374 family)